MHRLLACVALLLAAAPRRARAEDGYELWLRYVRVTDPVLLGEYRASLGRLVVAGTSPTIAAARAELETALARMLGTAPAAAQRVTHDGTLVLGTPATSPVIAALPLAAELRALGPDGYVVRATEVAGHRAIVVAGNRDIGVLYGTFALLREMQMHRHLRAVAMRDAPKVELRILDHWDNLDGSVERGYAGRSIWQWDSLPAVISPRYRDYARANASIGVNGAVLTNVNSDARIVTPAFIEKAAVVANVLRPYGIRVYLTARFSAPIEVGGLKTADPLDPAVRAWWKERTDSIYARIPDFGGFLVKANSEGQPGPQDYKRTHADGANMFADAVAPHGGVVMWRAFVYSNDVPTDRVKQAYDEFKPLDGSFRPNVLIQVKNGPLDFQPREPFHPLFGAMPKTPLMIEFEITKEYLGQDTHLVYLGRYFEEALRADTYATGPGSTVARVVDGSIFAYAHTGIAGVANIGSDRNWTGSQFNQANWYAFGRLAWNPEASSSGIAEEWIRMTFTDAPPAVAAIRTMMLQSREAVVNYMTPLGLAHIMATGHHYGPAPWVTLRRPDWSPTYYHRADSLGLGFDRTASGSNAVAQYFPPVRDRYASLATVPDSLLLWFHHVPWTYRMHSGRTLWDELVFRYNAGVDTVRTMQTLWSSVRPVVDSARFADVAGFLSIQEREARWWRDAALSYFQTFSRLPIPPGFDRPAHPLEYYERIHCPADRTKARCDDVP
ncbi:MAG TPA: alpha-glucuronidase family glycosyl hydrolase [Gemmatimonadaceae bacterium]|nr:alpha-glucuronidase family glycosyl hydrolase [Gemmatimonadaceae bacterium]